MLQGRDGSAGPGWADAECSKGKPGGGLGVLPALQKPTISHLSDEDWLAVNTMIDEGAAWEVIPRLKEAQAHGIVEYPLNKVVL